MTRPAVVATGTYGAFISHVVKIQRLPMSERVWKLVSFTKLLIAVFMVKNYNGIYENGK